MMQNSTQTTPKLEQQIQQVSRPNEQGQLIVQGHVKIFDPNTKQVYVEKRA
jgi:hypothetical protein